MKTIEYLNIVPKYENFKYWFKRIGLDKYKVTEIETNRNVGDFTSHDIQVIPESHQMYVDFVYFKERPEGIVGDINLPKTKETYEKLIIGAKLIRKYDNGVKANIDLELGNSEYLLKFLETSGFYSSPASTKYHDSVKGGLLVHSLNTYEQICQLSCVPKFANVDMASATLVALTHDWGKMRLYESYVQNKKDSEDGEWYQETAYRVNPNHIGMGHEIDSFNLANTIFKLNKEEMLAIRWHHGGWHRNPIEMRDLQNSNEKYPLVHMLQFADQLAITKY